MINLLSRSPKSNSETIPPVEHREMRHSMFWGNWNFILKCKVMHIAENAYCF